MSFFSFFLHHLKQSDFFVVFIDVFNLLYTLPELSFDDSLTSLFVAKIAAALVKFRLLLVSKLFFEV